MKDCIVGSNICVCINKFGNFVLYFCIIDLEEIILCIFFLFNEI